MRPSVLNPLFAPVTSLQGVGPKLGKLVEKAAGPHVADLLWHRPTGLIDRRFAPKIAEAPDGAIATLTVTVERHMKPGRPRLPYKVLCSDATGRITLVFFHAHDDYLERALPMGEVRVVSGTVERREHETQMVHPDHIGSVEDLAKLQAIEPVYRLTAGLGPRVMGKAVKAALDRAPDLPEWLDGPYRARMGWPAWHEAVNILHSPQTEADLTALAPARQRLAYDELLANQLALSLVRANLKKAAGRVVAGNGALTAKALAALPFLLTNSQERAWREIAADQAAPSRMLRLLQGDVGSGKTVVALMAMLTAVEAGGQAVLMAPLEILARQHLATMVPLAEAAGISIALLTGREKGKARQAVLDGLADGSIKLAVGTHALFQDDVAFKDLMLAVVDEQHRFGVQQRLAIAAKGRAADVLVMTATPIPRTLMLTAYGDMDVSRLTEKPPGRKPVDTRALPAERLDEVIDGVARALSNGAKVYWVCPLVEESETLDVAAAEERFDHLKSRFGDRVGLVHGRMKGNAKDGAVAAFSAGITPLLVATTVIEVGVDVPDATVMVVEHAERFGLAQLHQLRGRIGRSDKPSTCLLLYTPPLGGAAKARLSILRETEDGFRIAEEDLKLRGAGELLGTRQSGLPDFRLADLAAHGELLAAARDDARLILDRDPELTAPRGEALRVLLYLFERDAAIKFLRSG